MLGEGVLRQQVGGPAGMSAQLDHLVWLATERPYQIEIRSLPFSAGAHPALDGSFQILSSPSPRLPDLVRQEMLLPASSPASRSSPHVSRRHLPSEPPRGALPPRRRLSTWCAMPSR
ncbi:Scr1 family TA system antitoxin-like transcriptional regulator [Micromonospora nigra]|uniref:Scr1 family TA system antitoxin-like transcriptional regulator n=1 Tax=Micromonospora nigra TaxID=145857 RepID=UPI003CCB8207